MQFSAVLSLFALTTLVAASPAATRASDLATRATPEECSRCEELSKCDGEGNQNTCLKTACHASECDACPEKRNSACFFLLAWEAQGIYIPDSPIVTLQPKPKA